MLALIKTQPGHTVTNRIDIFLRLFLGIGVIKTQMTDTCIIMRNTKIQANTLGMPDMQITIGFRRETGLHTPIPFTGAIIFINNVANEI